jgi:hypothetical protein
MLIAVIVAPPVVWTIRGIVMQRRFDREIAAADAALPRYEYVLKRDAQRSNLRDRVNVLVRRAAAVNQGNPPAGPARYPPPRDGMPVLVVPPPTWNPLQMGHALRDRRTAMDEREEALARARRVETRLPELEGDIETLTAQLAELEAIPGVP